MACARRKFCYHLGFVRDRMGRPLVCGVGSLHREAGVAQAVERLTCNQQVVGSNPATGSRADL